MKTLAGLWNVPLIVGWAVRHARDMVTVEKQPLTQARAFAVRQKAVKLVVLEPDEGEYQGARQPLNLIDPAMEDVPSSPREAGLAALLVFLFDPSEQNRTISCLNLFFYSFSN